MFKVLFLCLVAMLNSDSYQTREWASRLLVNLNNEYDLREDLTTLYSKSKDANFRYKVEQILYEYYDLNIVGPHLNLNYFDVETGSREWNIIVTRTLYMSMEEITEMWWDESGRPYFDDDYHAQFVRTFLFWKMFHNKETRKQIDQRNVKAYIKYIGLESWIQN